MKNILIVALAAFGFLPAVPIAQDADLGSKKPVFRAKSEQSTDTPDQIAYRAFVSRIFESSQDGDTGGIHYVTDSLRIGHAPEKSIFAAETAAILLGSYVAMRTDTLQTYEAMICAGDRENRSDSAIYKILDAMDDVSASIAKKHYLIAQSQLNPEALDLVLAKVGSKKMGLFYGKLDHKAVYEKQGIDAKSAVTDICNQIRAELVTLTD